MFSASEKRYMASRKATHVPAYYASACFRQADLYLAQAFSKRHFEISCLTANASNRIHDGAINLFC